MPLKPDVIHLEVLGQQREIAVDVPHGDCTATDLLPAARSFSSSLAGAAIEDAKKQGRQVSCGAGCGVCCRQMVGVSAIEAAGVAATVAALPEDRRVAVESRFADAVSQLEEAGLLDPAQPRGRRTLTGLGRDSDAAEAAQVSRRYFSLMIACPFLEDESCSIYEDRPMMCREYNVSSPAVRCADIELKGVEKITPPVHVGVSLGRTAADLMPQSIRVMPLTLSLEWAHANKEELNQPVDGEQAYATWIHHLGGTMGA